jgi:hypothetical protein
LICIQNYTRPDDEELPLQKLERTFLVDGESTSILGLKVIAGTLFV